MKARTTERGPAFDLLAAWADRGFLMERRGEGVVGAGAAVAVGGRGERRFVRAAKEVERAFDSVLRAADTPLVAVGGGTFDPEGFWGLAIPIRSVVRRDGRTVQVDIEPAPVPIPPIAPGWPAAMPSDPFEHVVADPPPDVYRDAVVRAAAAIRAGDYDKVVLARSLVVEADRDLDVRALLARLRAVDPDAYTFATIAGRDGVLVGASPELLVRKVGRRVWTTPLAGSAPRGADEASDAASARRLADGEKERIEHRLVVDDVAAALRPLCEDLSFPDQPQLTRTATVWHLATPFEGVLRPEITNVLQVLDALHPTAAVAGLPRAAVAAALRELEPLDRGGYAGPVGWVDDRGDGEWAIALRCARVSGRTARLFAGAGIVGASDPDAELEETERKFRAFLDALRWG